MLDSELQNSAHFLHMCRMCRLRCNWLSASQCEWVQGEHPYSFWVQPGAVFPRGQNLVTPRAQCSLKVTPSYTHLHLGVVFPIDKIWLHPRSGGP